MMGQVGISSHRPPQGAAAEAESKEGGEQDHRSVGAGRQPCQGPSPSEWEQGWAHSRPLAMPRAGVLGRRSERAPEGSPAAPRAHLDPNT